MCTILPKLNPNLFFFQTGPKGGRRKGGRGRKLSHFSFCCAFCCCVVYSPCFPVWGEEKVMTIYDAGPLAAGPLCGLLIFLKLFGRFRDIPAKSLGKIQTGAHKRGLKPQIFRENRGEILPGKSGLFGANWGLFRADRGLFGADRDQFLRTPQPRGKSTIFVPIGAFREAPVWISQNPGISRLPHRRISGHKSLGLGSFLCLTW